VGLYSLVEAARLLNTPRRTLSRWVEGYVCQLRTGEKSYAPVIEREDEPALTFGDLVELLYVRGFRDAGVELEELRATAGKFRIEWGTQYPLATKRFATDGRNLLIEMGGEWEHALTGQHQAFFEEIGKHLVHVGDLASEWRPLGKDRAVLLDPTRAFGKPIEDRSGAHTYVLARALEAEQSADAVAWWFDTTAAAVQDAAEFERSFEPGTLARLTTSDRIEVL
jgi:uncharacterized protein (DUF433 family)